MSPVYLRMKVGNIQDLCLFDLSCFFVFFSNCKDLITSLEYVCLNILKDLHKNYFIFGQCGYKSYQKPYVFLFLLNIPQWMASLALSCLSCLSFGCGTSYPVSGSMRLWPWPSVALGIPQQDNICSSSRSTSHGF